MTSNICKLSEYEYKHLLTNAVTTTYKKANKNISNKINKQGKQIAIAKAKGVLNKMEVNVNSSCFITLKDHKDNFQNTPTSRLLNPANNEIGRISKVIR